MSTSPITSTIFNPQQIQKFKELFNLYDTDECKHINFNEFRQLLQNLKITNLNLETIQKLFRKADSDNDGNLNFEQFLKLMEKRVKLLKAFQAFDENKDGFISLEELKSAVGKSMGEKEAEVAAKKMLEKADTNLDGKVDYSEFVNLMG